MQQSVNSKSMLCVGTILRGMYRIDGYLSSGGFGNTYIATNTEFEETVAIKEFFMKGVTERDETTSVVSVSNADNVQKFEEQREKFKKEARRLRKLSNEHIVKVYDLFDENGTSYYVMDFIDGENLAERLKRTSKPISEKKLREILPQILDALKTVHQNGFCHLDLKPSNIMLEKSGLIKLIDFGASKQLGASGTLTTNDPTALAQTPGFAPREQMEQNFAKIGAWTDIYALGATLYNLLTKKLPPLPTNIDDDETEDKHVALPFPITVSDEMKSLVLSMMNTNRLKRPQGIHSLTSLLTNKPKKKDLKHDLLKETKENEEESETTKLAPVVENKNLETVAKQKTKTVDSPSEYVLPYPEEETWKDKLKDNLTDLKNILLYMLYLVIASIPIVFIQRCNTSNEEQPKDGIAVAVEDSLAYRAYVLDTLEYNSDISEKGRYIVNTYNKMLKNFVFVNGGTYEKGDPSGEWTSETHPCTVQSFWLSSVEVTQDLWTLVMESNPSSLKGDNLPVDNVSWNDCQLFVGKLNEKIGELLGATFRLPNDDEWEYAARGGDNSKGYKFSGSNDLNQVAWTDDQLHKVGQKWPNELGLYDMIGNVAEWVTCKNCYEDNGYGRYSITRGYNNCYDTETTRVLHYREKGLGFRIVFDNQ